MAAGAGVLDQQFVDALLDDLRGAVALADVDAILAVVDASRLPNEIDKQIARLARGAAESCEVPIILCLNKMDLLKPEFVMENTETFAELFGASEWMLTTATHGANVDKLMKLLLDKMPEGEPLYPDDEFTDQSTRFLVGEIVRERVLLGTRQEVPHSTAVQVESWEETEDGRLEIGAAIIVEKASQRAILIGKGGQFIKSIGAEARKEIEELLGRHIYLDLHVVVRDAWRQNPRLLRELEYLD